MLRAVKAVLRDFATDEKGVISVMGAAALVLALAVSMIVIDTGAVLYAKRVQQAATDAAALGAVRQIANAESAAAAILDFNNQSAGDAPVVATFYYVADPSRAPDQRYFAPGSTANDGTLVDTTNVNAVRVHKTGESPTYFAQIFGFGATTRIETVAVAALTKHVSFSAGTRLASLDAGLANQVLGGLLGTTLNLSLVDYNALAGTTIGALEFLDALALRVGLDAGSNTYGDLLGTTVTAGNILAAAADVLNGETANGNPSVARVALQTALTPVQNASVPVDALLDATPFSNRVIGSIQHVPGNDIPYNVFDLLSGTATILGSGEAVGFSTNVGIGTLAAVSGTISVGAPMAHMAVGKVGDSVQTSQVDIQLQAGVNVPLLGRVLDIPIYIHSARGMAAIASIPCEAAGTRAVLSGITETGVARFGTSANEGATISVPLLLSFNISGSVPIAENGPASVSFTESEFGSSKSISSDVNVISGLADALSITNLTLLGILNLTPLNTVLSALLSAISGALMPLDTVLDNLLATLGIKLGSMDMTVYGAKCNAPTLVT